MNKKAITIIGAGLVGSLLSIYLSKRGHKVRVFERRHDMRRERTIAGRSINLALSDRGIQALEEVGIMEEIRKICIPMHGRCIHNTDGSISYQPYGKEGQYINSVSRAELNKMLMDLAEKKGAEFFFDQHCEKIDWAGSKLHFKLNGSDPATHDFELLFGADGAYSTARLQYMLDHDRFQYNQHYIDFGYKELTIPAGANGEFLMDKNALHIWPRGNYMLIALPNTDRSFTCTLFFPFEGAPSFAAVNTKETLDDFFKSTFKDAYGLMPTLQHDFFSNPTSSLVTVRCHPWIGDDRFALIGDAAHAIVPFFGQGMNCGFEDCSVLDGLIEKYKENWKEIFKEYQRLRKPDGDAIAELALNNFVEMRDKVGDPRFLLQKKIEAKLHQRFPLQWMPVYSQVTFSPHIRYSEALIRGQRQEAIMEEIMKTPGVESQFDSEDFLKKIIEKL
jgi:kynurenine 3-monooxygenase